MSQQDMDRLRDVIATELGLARDGIGYEEAGVADEIVSKYVEPLLASAEASRRDWAAEAMRLEHELDVARGAEGKVLTEYEKLLKTYELKLNDFARETARVSAALQACDPDRVPLRVVGEALLGYEMAQRDIARAIETAAAVHPEADR